MDEELAECLLMWVQTFNVEGERDSPQALADGIAISQILHEVSASFFTEEWMLGIKTTDVNNKHLKISNLKKVLKEVMRFYEEELGLRVQESKKPNLKLVAEESNLLELGRLLQLVLGCAVNCDNKQDYIQAIMGMEESLQHGVMTAIQELMTQEPVATVEADGSLANQLQSALRELTDMKQKNIELSERCKELDQQVINLLEEKSHLENDNENLSEKAYLPEDLEDPNTVTGKKYLALQQQLEQYKDEAYRLDAAKEDYRMKYEFTSKELEEFREKNESLTALADQARALKDEVDVLRESEDNAKKYETTIESYKRKLEDMADLKRTVRILEEKNTSYMEKSVEWEEESKKTSSLKYQINVYKTQVQDLQTKISTETKRADKSEFEMKRIQEKLAGVQKEKDRISDELNSLREAQEEQEFADLQGMAGDGSSVTAPTPIASSNAASIFDEISEINKVSNSTGGDENIELMALPPALKEKFIRLQTENRMLKQKLADGGDNSDLQSLLDNANSRINEFESDSRINNKRIMELEAQVEDLQEASQKISGEGDMAKDFRRKIVESSQTIKSLENDLSKKQQYIETADSRLQSMTKTLKEKDEKLQQRENEMKEQEEKYKKYLEKAKSFIGSIESQQNTDSSSPFIDKLKNQLAEKEKQIIQIQKDNERQKTVREQEEKLMVSAWYNMGMSQHRKAVEERLNQYSGGQSFLARQRQVHSKRSTQQLTPTHR